MSIAFLVTTLVAVATPGTGVLYTLATGIAQGRRASVVAAFGCTLGIVPHMVATITGLAALLQTSALAFEIVKYLGVAYLVYMAWSTLRDKGPLVVDQAREQTTTLPATKVIVAAVLMNLLNPKLTIFFVAFLPQFVSVADPGQLWRMVELSLVFMALTFVVFALYGIFAAAMRDHVTSRPKVMAWLRRFFAVSFVALGVKLAFTQM
nr:LysE family translocator [Kibdelosporangium sp. MJ126-NF4]